MQAGNGAGLLYGVTSLAVDGQNYCGLLTSGGVDCWANSAYSYAAPVSAVGGSGTLSGVTSIAASDNGTTCALLGSGGIDCWGYGEFGELGNGIDYSTSPYGSATPIQVGGMTGGSRRGHEPGSRQ